MVHGTGEADQNENAKYAGTNGVHAGKSVHFQLDERVVKGP